MDNHFVPNLTIGLPVVKSLRRATDLPLDCHLMIDDPDRWAPGYAEAGAANVTFHIEAANDPRGTARDIRAAGALAGLSVKPGTPIEPYLELLTEFDTLLVMSVEPGFGGQLFQPEVLEKVRTGAGPDRRRASLRLFLEIEAASPRTPSSRRPRQAWTSSSPARPSMTGDDPAAAVDSCASMPGRGWPGAPTRRSAVRPSAGPIGRARRRGRRDAAGGRVGPHRGRTDQPEPGGRRGRDRPRRTPDRGEGVTQPAGGPCRGDGAAPGRRRARGAPGGDAGAVQPRRAHRAVHRSGDRGRYRRVVFAATIPTRWPAAGPSGCGRPVWGCGRRRGGRVRRGARWGPGGMRCAGPAFRHLEVRGTLDGRSAAADGSSRWVSNAVSRADVHACAPGGRDRGGQRNRAGRQPAADRAHEHRRHRDAGRSAAVAGVMDRRHRVPRDARVFDDSAETVVWTQRYPGSR